MNPFEKAKIGENFKRAIQFAKDGFEPSRKLVRAINRFEGGDEDIHQKCNCIHKFIITGYI